MSQQPQSRNTEIIKAFIAGNTNKAELARFFGVSPSTIRRVLTGVVLGVASLTVVQSADAALQDDELAAANQFISEHDDMPQYMRDAILGADSLATVNQQLFGSSYNNQSTQQLVRFNDPQEIKLLVKTSTFSSTSAQPVVSSSEPSQPAAEPDPQIKINTQAIHDDHQLINSLGTQLDNEDHQVSSNTQRISDLESQPLPHDGIDGKDGAAGINGLDGIDGKDGATGADGRDGVDGKDGVNGKDGATGANGHDGINGKDGADGNDGATGATGPTGATGANGADGHDGTDGKDGKDGKDADMTQVHKAVKNSEVALSSASSATSTAVDAQNTAEGIAKQQAIISGDRYQSMLHARAHSEMTAEVTTQEQQTQQQIKATEAKSRQAAQQQQRRSNYYDQQITALNSQAEENHAEVLSESHARAAGDQQTLQQSQNYTNQKFSDLKSQVDDNKKQANAGIAGVAAMANIPQVSQNATFSVGAGAGEYASEAGIAVGFSARINHNWVTKATIAGTTSNDPVIGAGFSAEW